MEIQEIDWVRIKPDYLVWRSLLYYHTKNLLICSEKVELSEFNDFGYFHHVPETSFRQMSGQWEDSGKVPEEWITKGDYPGIWTAMFDSHNTYSWAKQPVYIVRFYFKDGFFIYDKKNPVHNDLFQTWDSGNRANKWNFLENTKGQTMGKRMEFNGYPSHKEFFKENKFGAVVGYSDYISPVIVLEDSIENVEFIEV